MLENFQVALGAVVPLFILMGIGVIVKKYHWLADEELVHVNRMVFKVFFFCMMFYNIYTMDVARSVRPYLMLYGFLGVFIVWGLAMLLVPRIEPENYRRGAMVQAIFRSNFVLIGIPLVGNIFGDEYLAIPTMMIAVVVPIYNVLAVATLETFRGSRFDLLGIIRGIFKNPMIMGGILAVIFLLLGIKLPAAVLKPVGQVSAATTPVALIILGASFKGGSFHHHLRQLVLCVSTRLVIVPAAVLGVAMVLGFRGVDLVTLLTIFATPCAVASFAMAQQMGSDAELAGNCVVYTSALSCLTIFLWVLGLKTFGMF